MKYAIFFLILFCGCHEPSNKQVLVKLDSLQNRVYTLESAQANTNTVTDSLRYKLRAQRIVIKMQGKALRAVIVHSIQTDSILDKEIRNIGLSKKIGRRLRDVLLGSIGL